MLVLVLPERVVVGPMARRITRGVEADKRNIAIDRCKEWATDKSRPDFLEVMRTLGVVRCQNYRQAVSRTRFSSNQVVCVTPSVCDKTRLLASRGDFSLRSKYSAANVRTTSRRPMVELRCQSFGMFYL